MNKKNLIQCLAGAVLLAAVIVLLYRSMSKTQDLKSAAAVLSQVRPIFLLIAAGCGFAFILGEAINLHTVLTLLGKPAKCSDVLSYAVTGFFFSGITPSSSGGQPMQLYQMARDHISVSAGSLALLLELISSQTIITVLGSVGLLVHFGQISSTSPLLRWLAFGSIGFNVVLVLIILSMMRKKTWVSRIYLFLRNRINNCGCLSNEKKERWKQSVKKQVREFTACSQIVTQNPMVLPKMFLVSALQMGCFFSIPYIAYRGFGFDHLSLFSVLFMQAVLYLSVSIVPLPGATGVSEGSFVLLFRQLFPANAVAPTMLFSRGISFYFLLILSGLLLLAVRFISEKKIDET